MTRPDDSTLAPADLRFVQERASGLLDRADAWNQFPVPTADILDAANLQAAPTSAFDPGAILDFAAKRTSIATASIKSAISKVFGIYDAGEKLIHFDRSVVKSKQQFVQLHETGHHELPTHRKMFRFFQDCRKTLAPGVADQFEREANNFARFVLFKGTGFADHAADCPFGLKTPMNLARKFGASLYSSAREFVRTNERPCALIVLNPVRSSEDTGPRAPVRRTELSPSFLTQFGRLHWDELLPDHFLWQVIPTNSKMTAPIPILLPDRNGQPHNAFAEAFDTTYNILVLLYPVRALTATTVAMAASSDSASHPRPQGATAAR